MQYAYIKSLIMLFIKIIEEIYIVDIFINTFYFNVNIDLY